MRIPAERTVPLHRRIAVTWVGYRPAREMRARFCKPCDKLGLYSAEDARGYISLIMRSRSFEPRPLDYAFVPYACPHTPGLWHVGHNYTLIELLKGGSNEPGL